MFSLFYASDAAHGIQQSMHVLVDLNNLKKKEMSKVFKNQTYNHHIYYLDISIFFDVAIIIWHKAQINEILFNIIFSSVNARFYFF